jgi:ketosteroid isomerase-like protein
MPATRLLFAAVLAAASLAASASAAPASAKDQVWAAEVAFARSMADHDLQAFGAHLSDEALFFAGPNVLRGKAQVVDGWKGMVTAEQAPFSWAPDQVEVLDSGTLALSTGLVRDPTGKPVARFNSIWRLEGGEWHVVFDKGSPLPPAPAAPEAQAAQ